MPTQQNEKKTPKERLAPYKLYSFLLNSDMPSILRTGPWRVTVRTGPLSRRFRCRVSRLREWIFWLESQGLLAIIGREHGKLHLLLDEPRAGRDNETIK